MTSRVLAGYADEAPVLIPRFEGLSSAEVNAPVVHLLAGDDLTFLDVGAGTGRDAAWFAGLGRQVLAVEPVRPLRQAGAALHADPRIE